MDRPYTVKFKSREITFYPLSVKHIRSMPDEMKALLNVEKGSNPFDPERFTKLLRLYTASAQRGDPSVKDTDVEEVVAFGIIPLLHKALLGQSWWEAEDNAANDKAPEPVPTSPQIGGDSSHA